MSNVDRNDRWLRLLTRSCAIASAGILMLIIGFVLRESLPALSETGLHRVFVDESWNPTVGQFNLVPMIAGTLAVTVGAVCVAAPVGIGSAIFLNFYAPSWIAAAYRQICGVLAGIPSVVFGLWGFAVVIPLLAKLSPSGFGQCLLAGILILGLMTLPTVIVTADAAIRSVAQQHVRSAAALGLGKRAIIWSVVLPAARGGILCGIALQFARAIGETMAVVMVCGNAERIPQSLFDSVRTLTANIALEMGYADAQHRSMLFVSGLVLLTLVTVLMLLIEWMANRQRRRSSDGVRP